MNFSYFVIRFLLDSSLLKSDNELGRVKNKNILSKNLITKQENSEIGKKVLTAGLDHYHLTSIKRNSTYFGWDVGSSKSHYCSPQSISSGCIQLTLSSTKIFRFFFHFIQLPKNHIGTYQFFGLIKMYVPINQLV